MTSAGRTVRSLAIARDSDTLHVIVAEPEDPNARPLSTVVFAHGAGGCHLNLYAQIDAFSKAYRVVVWDQRGYGASTGPTHTPTPEIAATDLLAILTRVLGDDDAPVHLVGQSLGGWAVTKAVLMGKRDFASLTLSGSIGGMFSVNTHASLEAFTRGARQGAGKAAVVGRTAALAPEFGRRSPRQALLFHLLAALPGPGVGAVEEIRSSVVEPSKLASTGVPVQFIVGEHDGIFAPHDVANVAQSIPGAALAVIDGAGHSPYYEAPTEFNELVARFVQSVDSRAAS